MAALLELIPNISNGRDAALIQEVAEAFASTGATLLDVDSDADHNRSVITLAGTAEELIAGAAAGVAAARDRIDLNQHEGAHPRMGATDVVPFVPLGDATTEDAVAAARAAAARIWQDAGVPTYLYGKAAQHDHRKNLAKVRKGQFEGLRESIPTDPARHPDFGDPAVHATAGVTAVGARFFLIAYNVNLDTKDLDAAKEIAVSLREKNGGLPGVKAMGFDLPEKGQVQVSMNLVDYRKTSPTQVFDVIAAKAEERGIPVAGSEVVGLIPAAAAPEGFAAHTKVIDWDPDLVIEARIARLRG